ncbi:MAG: RNA-binding protein [Chlorobiaceae bacterium]|nr:RNA-binding protein [Chlorobiaceae bacterium]
MNIYIGNLDYGVTDADLRRYFEVYGEVSNSTVIIDKFTDRSKGFGFVEMPNNEDANKAIDALNNSDMNGRNIKVNEAQPREPRKPSNRNFRSNY